MIPEEAYEICKERCHTFDNGMNIPEEYKNSSDEERAETYRQYKESVMTENVFKLEGFDGCCTIQIDPNCNEYISVAFNDSGGLPVLSSGVTMTKRQAILVAKELITLSGSNEQEIP